MPIIFGRAASGGKRDETRQRLHPSARARSALITTAAAAPSLICELFPAVTSAVRMERGLQLRERFQRSICARAFVRIKYRACRCLRARAAMSRLRRFEKVVAHFDRHDFVLEFAGRDRGKRLSGGSQREFVGLLARDAVFLGHVFGRETHVR